MKKDLTILMVAVVGVLLIVGIGITFAYYASTVSVTGAGPSANQTTSTVGNVTLTSSALTLTNANKVDYPGGYIVVAEKIVTANTDTSKGYTATFTVNGTISNGTATALNWTLYKSTSSVTSPLTGCSLSSTPSGTSVRYNYTGCTIPTTVTGTSEANKVANGTAAAGTVSSPKATTVSKAGETIAAPKSGSAQTTVYYYLVVQYPNSTSASQNTDMGGTITASLNKPTATALAAS